MTRVDGRVRHLELAHGTPGECPECGFDGDWSKIEFKSRLVGPGEGTGPQDCGTCGRPLVIVVGWGEGGPAA